MKPSLNVTNKWKLLNFVDYVLNEINLHLSLILCQLVHYKENIHYSEVIIRAMASQITSLTVYSTVSSGAEQR